MPAFEERPAEDAEGAMGEYDLAVEENTRLQDHAEIEEFRRNLSWALREVCVPCIHLAKAYAAGATQPTGILRLVFHRGVCVAACGVYIDQVARANTLVARSKQIVTSSSKERYTAAHR